MLPSSMGDGAAIASPIPTSGEEEGKRRRGSRVMDTSCLYAGFLQVAISSCTKRVTDLFHEARLIAHVWYYHKVKREKLTKTQARQVVLTSEQYLPVPT